MEDFTNSDILQEPVSRGDKIQAYKKSLQLGALLFYIYTIISIPLLQVWPVNTIFFL